MYCSWYFYTKISIYIKSCKGFTFLVNRFVSRMGEGVVCMPVPQRNFIPQLQSTFLQQCHLLWTPQGQCKKYLSWSFSGLTSYLTTGIQTHSLHEFKNQPRLHGTQTRLWEAAVLGGKYFAAITANYKITRATIQLNSEDGQKNFCEKVLDFRILADFFWMQKHSKSNLNRNMDFV